MSGRPFTVAITIAVTFAGLTAACSGSEPTTAGTVAAAPVVSTTSTTDQTTVVESSSSTAADTAGTAAENAEDEAVEVGPPPAVIEAYRSRAAIEISPLGGPLPQDPSTMAAALTEAERAVRDPTLDADERSRWGRWQQRLYHHLAAGPDMIEPTLNAVARTADVPLAEAVALNWEARENLIRLLGTETTHSAVPAWRISTPPPADELLRYYVEAEAETGVAWPYVAAINLVETRMGRIQGVSTAGAVGPMQFLPSTWAECCDGDPTDPRDAILGAATYLTHRGAPDDMAGAIWGYNNSDYYVNAVTAYARVMMADERAYHGYHAWQIYFLTSAGVIYLAEGYDQPEEVPAIEWLSDNPGTLVTP